MIDYSILHESTLFYESKGFKRIESPWTVTKEISGITKPPEVIDYEIIGKNKVLVGSGEQSFLYLYLKGFLPPGNYQTITPCFREEIFDFLHTKYFIKNELIVTEDVDMKTLLLVLESAKDFFSKYLDRNLITEEWDRKNLSVDLLYDGIEIGSYGIRSCNFLKWIFGTGAAEPRLSNLKNKRKYK